MPRLVEIGLALILFFPTFCILGALYCVFPRAPRPARRGLCDALAVVIAGAASGAAMVWGFRAATGVGSAIWRQLFATLLAYAAFSLAIAVALAFRAAYFAAYRKRTGASR